MPNQLAGFIARSGKPKPIHHAVKTSFQQHQEVFASDTFHPVSFMKVRPKLLFQQSVRPLHTLLFAQLGAIIRDLDPTLAMLPWRVVAAFDRALVSVTSVTLKEQFHIFPPAHAADGTCISSQRSSSL
jgi:hypothetical protein